MPPRIASSVRRAEIMEAAMRCLQRTGYSSLSMDDVVKESGLSKGTIYWHFKNKKDLFISLFESLMSQAIAGFTPLLTQELPAAEKLRQILSSVSEVTEEDLNLVTLPLTLLTEMLNDTDFVDRYRMAIGQLAKEMQTIIEQGIAAGEFKKVDSFETIWALMSVYDGQLMYHILNMPGSVKKQNKIIVDLIIAGLKK
ncbi:MAG: TetR/AcrR family transcriptional regulator [Chloroflexi bacterium]|nr:MAG: TetR/AcrR family transcriptional regulator [Chloroflexota bacterium]